MNEEKKLYAVRIWGSGSTSYIGAGVKTPARNGRKDGDKLQHKREHLERLLADLVGDGSVKWKKYDNHFLVQLTAAQAELVESWELVKRVTVKE